MTMAHRWKAFLLLFPSFFLFVDFAAFSFFLFLVQFFYLLVSLSRLCVFLFFFLLFVILLLLPFFLFFFHPLFYEFSRPLQASPLAPYLPLIRMKFQEFVFQANWDTSSLAIARLLVMVSSTLLAHRGGEGHGDELRSW